MEPNFVQVVLFISTTALLHQADASSIWRDWRFDSTQLEGIIDGRMAKPGDICHYPSWIVHSQPILAAIQAYVAAKKDLRGEFEKALKHGRTHSTTKYEFIWELASNISVARMHAAMNLESQITSKNLTYPYDIEDTGYGTSKLAQLVCEGGQLLVCTQKGNLELGFCHCFDLPEGEPMYTRKEEDGICKAPVGASCDPMDPVISTQCSPILQCRNYTQAACTYAFGKKYHCDGNGAGYIGTKNMYCYRAGRPPEHDNDNVGANVEHVTATSFILFALIVASHVLN